MQSLELRPLLGRVGLSQVREQGHQLLFTEGTVVPVFSVHPLSNFVGNSQFFHLLGLVLEVFTSLLVVFQVGYVCAAERTTNDIALKRFPFFLLDLNLSVVRLALT